MNHEIVAVLDIGKTNVKLLLINRQCQILEMVRRPNLPLDGNEYLELDSEGTWEWFLEELRLLTPRWIIDAVVTTTHGISAAIVDDDGLVLPMMDYESEPPVEINTAYDVIQPDFEETFSPILPACMNLARQIFWMQTAFAEEFAKAKYILTYPQYLAWRLCGVAASEVTSLGAHTQLWNPAKNDYSTLVDGQNWRHLFPQIKPAWSVLGVVTSDIVAKTGLNPLCKVLSGIHDSNSALFLFLRATSGPFSLVSTGTWVILCQPGGTLDHLDETRDTLGFVDVFSQPFPVARFMGGREYTFLTDGIPIDVVPTIRDFQKLIDDQVFALPSFASAGSFPAQKGKIVGNGSFSQGSKVALAILYVALMTDYSLELLPSEGKLIIDGGFTKSQYFASILAKLQIDKDVVMMDLEEGTSMGAAQLVWIEDWEQSMEIPMTKVEPISVSGLAKYVLKWREMSEEGLSER